MCSKGAYSAIATPGGDIHFNSSGNPGMATAGSGDVLTGVITALLSQGYPPLQAAMIGCFVHGHAGDIGADELSLTGLTASHIAAYLPTAFKIFEQ